MTISLFSFFHLYLQNANDFNLCATILSTHSDPYVRIDLNTINGDINIDSVLTKTKKKVRVQIQVVISDS